MPSSATLRLQIERILENRFPAALSPAPRGAHEVASTGIEKIDALLNGGLPVGAISELTGSASSGRTSLAMAFLAQRTAEGQVCAWVDANDTLDPESAAANGLALPQLLWVRCREKAKAPQTDALKSHDFTSYKKNLASASSVSGLWSEERRGSNKINLTSASCVSGHDFSRAENAQIRNGALAPERNFPQKQSSLIWTRLDQALRATDLLLQAGGFAAIVLDLGDTAREHASRIPLATWFRYRQAANSAVCYALEITAVDPVGMELLFERFLSESRGEWPDIDLDLPSGGQREQVIQHIYEKYGAHSAAMTANVITYRGRSAAREVGKALGFDEEQLSRLSSLFGHWEWRGVNDTMEHHFRNAGFDIRHPRIAHYLDLCMRMQDLPRHLGQHSGGMVICAGLLNRVVPIERASMPGRTVIQWDKEDCADLGLIKVDLLGLGMMAVLKDSIELIPRHYGKNVDLARSSGSPRVRIAGCVIARQRPGTAKGFVFLSLEDETGIANVILTPDIFERDRIVVTRSRFLRVEGPLQNQSGVIHVKAERIMALEIAGADIRSHDFH